MMGRFRIESERLDEDKSPGNFEFTIDSIEYSDHSTNRKLTWEEVKELRIIKSVLFIIVDPLKGDILALGKEEIGNDNFKKLLKFIESRKK